MDFKLLFIVFWSSSLSGYILVRGLVLSYILLYTSLFIRNLFVHCYSPYVVFVAVVLSSLLSCCPNPPCPCFVEYSLLLYPCIEISKIVNYGQ